MSALIDSLVPVFLVIVAGWAARSSGLVAQEAWSGFEKVTYHILFPALIISVLAKADLGSVPFFDMGAVLACSVLAMAALLVGLRHWLSRHAGVDGPAFCSIFQGVTRWNSFVALGLAANLHGSIGLTLASVSVVAMVPLLNVLAVAVHARYASAEAVPFLKQVQALAGNPFIWSCALGIFLNLTGLPTGKTVGSFLDILGRASLGAGLLVVGAGLDLRGLRRPKPALAIGVGLRLVGMPLVAWMLALLAGLSGPAMSVTILSAAVPAASGSYILSRQMGGDFVLMAEILTLQTLAAMLTLPLAMALLG